MVVSLGRTGDNQRACGDDPDEQAALWHDISPGRQMAATSFPRPPTGVQRVADRRITMSRRLTLGSILLLVGFATAAADAADKLVLPLNLTVEAGQRERVDALVQFPLPPGTPE